MTEPLRITVVNAAFDPAAPDFSALLARYPTLTQWSEALCRAGACVEVVQRFTAGATLVRGGVTYHAVIDGRAAVPAWHDRLPRVADAAARTAPHIVHVNGLGFPALVGELARSLDSAAIVVQDHAGCQPPGGDGWRAARVRRRWRDGLGHAHAVSFTAAAQAAPWHEAGLLRHARVLPLVESSTTVRPTARAAARRQTGLEGSPLVLWVGRLEPGKDPLTALAGFEEFCAGQPDARLAIISQGGSLADEVAGAVRRSSRLARAVRLVGPVRHDAIGDYFGAADVYLSASHAEGSGYALLEAMACGVVPAVTAIPPYLAITGGCGRTWPPGDARACARALQLAWSDDHEAAARATRARFDAALSWPALASQTLALYRPLVDALRSRRGA